MKFLRAPELLWTLLCVAAWLYAQGNKPPYPRNDTLMTMAWVVPFAGMGVSFWLYFMGTHGSPWWVLVRTTLACAVGTLIALQVLLDRVNVGSANPGVGTLFMVVLIFAWGLDGVLFLAGIFKAARAGGTDGLLHFMKSAVVVVAVVVGLFGLISWWASSQVTKASGESKARALSAAYGRSIGARSPADWRNGGWNWVRFQVAFAAPNAVVLTVRTEYKPRRAEAVLAAMQAELGKAILTAVKAQLAWRPELEDGELVWRARVEMDGLSEKRFIEQAWEARRLCDSALGDEAPNCAWFLLGESVNAAMEVEAATGSRRAGAEAMLAKALGHTARYARNGAKDIDERRAKAEGLTVEQAAAYLTQIESKLEELVVRRGDVDAVIGGWDEKKLWTSGHGRFVTGSVAQIRMAQNYIGAMPAK